MVSGLAFRVIQAMKNASDRKTQETVNRSHPFGVASGQIVVYGNNVNPFAGQGIQIGRKGGGKGFAFAGLHFRDFSLMKHHAADQLSIEVAHVQGANRGLPYGCKCFREQIIQGFALFNPLLEAQGLGFKFIVAEGFHGGFKGIDLSTTGQSFFNSRSFLLPNIFVNQSKNI